VKVAGILLASDRILSPVVFRRLLFFNKSQMPENIFREIIFSEK
jgi:hypothetical protein